jgi:hypothetical protein
LGLYEYYKSKNLARKQKEDDIREGRRVKSKSPSPLRRDASPSGRSPPRRRYQRFVEKLLFKCFTNISNIKILILANRLLLQNVVDHDLAPQLEENLVDVLDQGPKAEVLSEDLQPLQALGKNKF